MIVPHGSLPTTRLVAFGEQLLAFNTHDRAENDKIDLHLRSARYTLQASTDGARWVTLSEDVFGDIAPDAAFFEFLVFDGKLWAIESSFAYRHDDVSVRNRVFRSSDGLTWEQKSEKFKSSPIAPTNVIAADDRLLFHSYWEQPWDGFGTQPPSTEPGSAYWTTNGSRWRLSLIPKLADLRTIGFRIATVDNRALHLGVYDENFILDVKELTLTPLAIKVTIPDDNPDPFMTERRPDPVTAPERRVLVAHNDSWYVTSGGRGADGNEFDFFISSPNRNDVWRSADGLNWELISRPRELNGELDYAFDTFPERSGAQVVSWRGVLYLTGGAGLGWIPAIGEPGDPDYIPAGPGYHYGRDVWVSRDGIAWHLLAREEGAYERARAEYMEGERAFYFKRRREFEASQ